MPDAPPIYRPTIAKVSSSIRARTTIPGAGIAGVFTEDTVIRAKEVEPLIDEAVDLILAHLGGVPCTEELQKQMIPVAALLAAMLVEQRFFPEQTTSAGNSFSSLEKLYKPKAASLAEQVEKQCGTGGGGEGGDGAGSAVSRATFDARRLI